MKAHLVGANSTTFRLYQDYADWKDDDELCSFTLDEGDSDDDFCGENVVQVTLDSSDNSTDSVELTVDEYYAVQFYSQAGLVEDWTDNPVCPDDIEEYDSYVAEFYPYLDTESSGLNLDGKKFKLFGTDAEIVDVDTAGLLLTFEVDGDEFEVEDGDSFEYRGTDYDVNLIFGDGGLERFEAEPA